MDLKQYQNYLQTIVLAPITSSSKPYPTRIEIDHKSKQGWIVLDQIRTVDRKRIIKIGGNLNEKEIVKVKEVIREAFVD